MLLAPLSVLVASALALSTTTLDHQSNAAPPTPDESWGEGPSEGDPAAPEGADEDPGVTDDAAAVEEAPPVAPLDGSDTATSAAASDTGSPGATAGAAPVPRSELKLPEKNGTGFMIVSGGLGAVGWLLMSARIAVIRSRCKPEDPGGQVTEDTVSDTVSDFGDCFGARGVNAGLWVLQAPVNAANWGIAPVAAIKRAQYNAARDVKAGNAAAPVNAYVGGGAALLGAGVIGRLAVVYLRIRGIRDTVSTLSGQCLDGDTASSEDFFKCYANRQTYFYLGHQFSSAAIAGGAGLLAYGLTYKKRRAALERMHPNDATAKAEFTLTPSLSANYTGLSGTLRF